MHCSDVNHRSVEGMDGGHGGVVRISMCMSPVVAVLLWRQWLHCSGTSGCIALAPVAVLPAVAVVCWQRLC
jgi:hypothetical protein